MVENKVEQEFSFDGLDYLLKDHQQVKRLFQEYLQDSTNSSHKQQIIRQFTTEIVKHASCEERYLYPILTEKLGEEGGKLIYHKNLLDDLMTKEMLRFLEQSKPLNDFDWLIYDQVVRKFIQMTLTHMEEEEKDVFPIIRRVLNGEELATLEDCLKWAKEHGPTHPHPFESLVTPQAQITHPITGKFDRLRDERISHNQQEEGGGGSMND